MLSTLLTAVMRLSDISLVKYERLVLRLLLGHRTPWHAENDAWLSLSNILPQYSSSYLMFRKDAYVACLQSLPNLAFTQPLHFEIAPDAVPVVYAIQSLQLQEIYVGSTDHREV